MSNYEELDPYGTYDAKGETSPYGILNQMKSWNKEIRLTVSDGFEQQQAQIAILDDEIALKVSNDEIIQSINLSNEGLKINVSKMDITGLVTISALASAGQTTIHGGSIMTDTVLADAIFVTNLSALSANLGTINAGVINGIQINSANINIAEDITIGSSINLGSGSTRAVKFNGTGAWIWSNGSNLNFDAFAVNSLGYLSSYSQYFGQGMPVIVGSSIAQDLAIGLTGTGNLRVYRDDGTYSEFAKI